MASAFPHLELINSPKDLRALSVGTLPILAKELRAYMVETVSKTGGHLSSSLGAVDLAIALHRVFDTPEDRIVWDVGHQAYAHKILTGRREAMSSLRTYKGISGFPRRCESPYDAFGVGHSSTSISAALGMAVADRVQGKNDRWHIAVIGDGALTGGMAIEALNDAGAYKDGMKLLIILNDNDCSISRPAGALSEHLAKVVSTRAFNSAREISKTVLKPVPQLWEIAKRMEKQAINFVSPPSGLFSTFDLNYYGPVDGHDIAGLVHILENLKELDCPMVLHVVTQKGKGYPRAEQDPTSYHGVKPFDPTVGMVASEKKEPNFCDVFGQWAIEKASKEPLFYAITPAMCEGSGLVKYSERFPERYRDVAIAEQHAVTYAAGLAAEGLKPVLAIYSTFLQRAIDQWIHDVAIQKLPVTLAIDRAGLVGADGATHHGVFDIAQLRQVPNTLVMTPSNEKECVLLLNTALASNQPAAVRYPRGKGTGVEAQIHTNETLPIGKANRLREGKRVALMGFGTMTNVLNQIASDLDATLVDMRFVKPLDKTMVLSLAQTHDLLVTAEEGILSGGAGSAVMECLEANEIVVPLMRFGIPDEFVEHGDEQSLKNQLGLLPEQMLEKIKKRLTSL